MNPHTIAYVAGKSGGHIIPALTLAQHYCAEHPSAKIIFFSTNSNLDKKLLENYSEIHHIPLWLDNIPRKNIVRYPLFLHCLIVCFLKSFYYLLRFKPKKIISMGGYISLPVCIAAWILRIPIKLYEFNVIPGKAVNYLAPCAQSIAICFEKTKKYLPQKKCSMAPYPLRFSSSIPSTKKEKLLGNNNNRKTVLIFGGSQGSLFINNTLQQCLLENPQLHKRLSIIHQTGTNDPTNWEEFYSMLNIPAIVFNYHHALDTFYHTADLIICRSGAGSLFEVLHFKKLCITIPLETKINTHQVDNAYAIAQQYPHLFTVLRQKEIKTNKDLLQKTISYLLATKIEEFPSYDNS